MTLKLTTPVGTLGKFASAALVFAAGYLLVTFAHEWTHFFAARTLGVKARISVGPHLETEFVVSEERSRWVDRSIQLAPTVVGLVVGAAAVALLGWPDPTVLGGVLTFLWLWYTLPSPDDVLGQRWEDADYSEWSAEQKAVISLALWTLAGCMALARGVTPALYDGAIWQLSQGVALAGVVHFIALLATNDVTPDPEAAEVQP